MTPIIEQASRSTIHWDPTLQFDPEPPPSRRATAGQRGDCVVSLQHHHESHILR